MTTPSDSPRVPRLLRRLASAVRPGSPPDAPAGGELPEEPLLSVIIPIYDVEEYLAECLDSVLAQSYPRLEVILVDDGSPDGSADIARGYVDRDDRVRLISQQNAGLGAARNTGLDAATGELVAFADSDDTVPQHAYRRMVRTLRQSGSDFVVGAFVRDEGGVDVARPWIKQAHDRRRLAVTIDEVPELLSNVFAWSKVFRRDFIDRSGLRFPVGVRYEDQVPITRAYLVAKSFDVLPDTVYRWRRRQDGTSLTQQKTQLHDLRDRLTAKREIARTMGELASPSVLRQWYVKTFRVDLFAYFRFAAEAGDDYWGILQGDVVSLTRSAPPDVDDHIEVRFRVAMWLARTDQRAALDRWLEYEGLNSSNFPVHVEGDELFADLDFLREGDVDLPRDLFRLRPVDLQLRPLLGALDWSTEGRLSVRSLAVLRHVDPGLHEVATSYRLTAPTGRALPEITTTVHPDPGGNEAAGRVHEDHTDSTVVGGLDLAAVVRASAGQGVTPWEVTLRVAALGVQVEAPFDARARHGSAVTAKAVLVDDALVSTRWSETRGLFVEVRRRYAALTGARSVEGFLELDVRVPAGRTVDAVWLGDAEVPATTVPSAGAEGLYVLRLAPADLAGTSLPERVRVGLDEGEPVRLIVVDELEAIAATEGGVALRTGPDGTLRVVADEPLMLVDDVRFGDAGTVTLSGRVHRVGEAVAWLEGARADSAVVPVEVVAGTFTVSVPTSRVTWGGQETVLPANLYELAVDSAGGRVGVLAGRVPDSALPRGQAHAWTVEVDARRRLQLRRSRHEDPLLSSSLAQERLRTTVYEPARHGPRADRVVFECFGGTAAGDSPRALCEALLAGGTELDLVWSVNDLSVPVPPGTRRVMRQTSEWFDAVGSARYLVNNSTFPAVFRKAPDQVYVQTWHGTPLKRIGHDIANPMNLSDNYFRQMDREAAAWDYLLSPSPFCTEIFPHAFRYDGEVLELGYPRNDVLVAPGTDAVRLQVRAELGIPPDQKVVLYAPTWRENARRGRGWDKVLYLDSDVLTAARSDVTVLVRGHANTAGRAHVKADGRVLDVTSYPDLGRLYLAADVLVTDYSSVMFDFALTDRPVILLVPDLEVYRDGLRGFYLDFEAVAPGPLVRTTEDVLAHLDGDDAWVTARAQMRARFSPHEDGRAGERVLARVLGPR